MKQTFLSSASFLSPRSYIARSTNFFFPSRRRPQPFMIIFIGIFSDQCYTVFAFCSGTLDWIVLILVWFKRSLYSAQVSRQSCPWALKLMISQAVEVHGSARVVTCGSGTIPLCWHDTLWPLLRIAGFLPASWPVQWSSVEVTSKYRPTHLPWWQLKSRTLIIQHVYCPGSCCFLQ